MSLLDLANALRNQLPDTGVGSMLLDEKTLQTSAATNVSSILEDLIGYLKIPSGQSLVISEISRKDLPDPENNVFTIVKGTTHFLSAQMSIVKLEFQMKDEKILLLSFEGGNLTDNERDTWYFSTSFPSFFVILFLDNHIEHSSFIFSSSEALPWTIGQNALILKKGLNFYTQLDVTAPSILTVINFLNTFFKLDKSAFDFYLFGPIDMTNPQPGILDFPYIALESPTKQTNLVNFFNIKIQNPRVGIRLVEIPKEDEKSPQEMSPELYVCVEIPIDDIKLEFSAALNVQSSFLQFSVTTTHPLTMPHVCEKLMGISESEWNSLSSKYIPQLLMKGLDDIVFQGFSATLFLDDLPFLSSLTTRIGSGKEISFPPFKDFNFYFDWTFLIEDKTNLFDFGAEVELVNIGTFNVEISKQ